MSKVHRNAAGIIIKNRAVLMVRPETKDFFISPGGGIEPGETPEFALCRELQEECSIIVREEDVVFMGLYKDAAYNHPGDTIEVRAYFVRAYRGKLTPNSEIVEHSWFNSENVNDQDVGSIFKDQVIPELTAQGLID